MVRREPLRATRRIFLLGDEAFYAGDKAHVGILKTIITEPTLTIEGKFRDAILVPNFLHVMLTANAEWVVPASLSARRLYVAPWLRRLQPRA